MDGWRGFLCLPYYTKVWWETKKLQLFYKCTFIIERIKILNNIIEHDLLGRCVLLTLHVMTGVGMPSAAHSSSILPLDVTSWSRGNNVNLGETTTKEH